MSVGWLVGWLDGLFTIYFFGVFELLEHIAPALVTFSCTAPAYSHATRVNLYLTLLVGYREREKSKEKKMEHECVDDWVFSYANFLCNDVHIR